MKTTSLFSAMLALSVVIVTGFGTGVAAQALPDVAKGVAIPQDKGYAVEKLGDGLYFVTDGFYTTMFMTTGSGVIVVDAPPTLGDKMLKAIGDTTTEPIAFVIYSHAHADHIGSAALYPKDAIYIAQKETLARLESVNDPKRLVPYGMFVGGKPVPLPTLTFEKKYDLKVGNQELELTYRGENHEPGNIYIYARKQKVLMVVDIVFPGWTPFKGLAIAENVPGYIKAHDEILAYDFEKMVTGHWGRTATRQDVTTQREYLTDIQNNAATALKTVDFYGIAKKTGMENISLLFETYLNAVTQSCTDATMATWKGRLGGVETWTFGHCYAVMMALRVD